MLTRKQLGCLVACTQSHVQLLEVNIIMLLFITNSVYNQDSVPVAWEIWCMWHTHTHSQVTGLQPPVHIQQYKLAWDYKAGFQNTIKCMYWQAATCEQDDSVWTWKVSRITKPNWFVWTKQRALCPSQATLIKMSQVMNEAKSVLHRSRL